MTRGEHGERQVGLLGARGELVEVCGDLLRRSGQKDPIGVRLEQDQKSAAGY